MKFYVIKHEFEKHLKKCAEIASMRTNLMITQTVRIEAKDNKISLYATNLDLEYKTTFEAEVIEPGIACIFAKDLFGMIKEYPAEKILFNQEGPERWYIIGEKSPTFKIAGMNADDMPDQMLSSEPLDTVQTDADILKKILHSGAKIQGGKDERRAYVACIDFDGEYAKSTDSKRLYRHKFESGKPFNISKINVPAIIGHIQGPVNIKVYESSVTFESSSGILGCKQIEGGYPDVKALFNSRPDTSIIFEKSKLADTLRRCLLVMPPDFHSAKFTIQGDKMKVYSSNPDLGEFEEEISIEYNGSDCEICANPRFMLDAINICNTEQIEFYVKNESSPIFILGGGSENVVMPVKM